MERARPRAQQCSYARSHLTVRGPSLRTLALRPRTGALQARDFGSWPPIRVYFWRLKLPMNRKVAQVFQPAGSGDFPVARWNGGLESPPNPQSGKTALQAGAGSWPRCASSRDEGVPPKCPRKGSDIARTLQSYPRFTISAQSVNTCADERYH